MAPFLSLGSCHPATDKTKGEGGNSWGNLHLRRWAVASVSRGIRVRIAEPLLVIELMRVPWGK